MLLYSKVMDGTCFQNPATAAGAPAAARTAPPPFNADTIRQALEDAFQNLPVITYGLNKLSFLKFCSLRFENTLAKFL